MASKSSSISHESALAEFPPQLSLDTELLASDIDLPDHPTIHYSVFEPAESSHDTESIEAARRNILKYRGNSIVDALTCSVRVDKTGCSIYVFAISSSNQTTKSLDTLRALKFEALKVTESSSFSLAGLYPCSVSCSNRSAPCPSCLSPDTNPFLSTSSIRKPASSASCYLPRRPLRSIYAQFLEAIRIRVLDNIAKTSCRGTKIGSGDRRYAMRLQDGFLLGPLQKAGEWSAGWNHHALSRPLIHFRLQLMLKAHPNPRILIFPDVRATSFLSLLSYYPQLSAVPFGTPINILPYGTPAYYLTSYNGPTSTLTAQFSESLEGLGLGDWANDDDPKGPRYVIAYIEVQNKHGEDKGLTLVYPARLCLCLHPSSAAGQSRQPLGYMPSLPPQLQPSPSAPEAKSAASASNLFSPHTQPDQDICTPTPNRLSANRPPFKRARTFGSSETLGLFRSLTLDKSKPIDVVATEVDGYVSTIAKEREKERERLKKEREIAQAGSPARTGGTPGDTPSAASGLNERTPGQAMSPARAASVVVTTPGPLSNLSPAVPLDVTQTTATTTTPLIPLDMQASAHIPPIPSSSSTPLAPIRTPLIAPSARIPNSTSDPYLAPFDSFPSIDSSWPSVSNDNFMDFGMPMDIDAHMNYDPMNVDMSYDANVDGAASGGAGLAGRNAGAVGDANNGIEDFEDGFEAFTDADFSFFDRPSGPAAVASVSVPPLLSSRADDATFGGLAGFTAQVAGSAPALGFSPPFFSENAHTSSMGPPSSTPFRPQSSPWHSGPFGDGFTPTPQPADFTAGGQPPVLSPPSASQTPSSLGPSTPGVRLLTPDSASTGGNLIMNGSSVFDPVPFASYHSVLDGKYAIGKFALQSNSDPDRLTEALLFDQNAESRGWKLQYKMVTDPRLKAVQRLVGVKRKTNEKGLYVLPAAKSWMQDVYKHSTDAHSASEDEASSESDEPSVDDEDVLMASRPSTPLPPYLPAGPQLIHTQFYHSQLLPLGTPVRAPSTVATPVNNGAAAAPASVPTPVSPAAGLAASQEKSKTLEAAAHILAKEVVENSVWADTWRTNAMGHALADEATTEIWQADVKKAAELLEGYYSSKSLRNIHDILGFRHSSLNLCRAPLLAVSKSNEVIQVRPTALRFWEKLGLCPRGGKKDVAAFAVFSDDGEERLSQAQTWLAKMSSIYSARSMGAHVPGKCDDCPRDGLVPVRMETIKKTLLSFISKLTAHDTYVFYVITPPSTLSLSSPVLRQIFSLVKKSLKTSESQILYQLVPEELVFTTVEDPIMSRSLAEMLTSSSYNRVLRPVDRSMSRRFAEHGQRMRSYFQEPAFALGRVHHNKPHFSREARALSLDVLDRHTFLHIGYQTSNCGRWLLISAVDQFGDTHDFSVSLTSTESLERHNVSQVWSYAVQIARKANVEWRLTITRRGSMTESELDAWIAHLANAIVVSPEHPAVHVYLLCVEQQTCWRMKPPSSLTKLAMTANRTPQKDPAKSAYVDTDFSIYILSPRDPILSMTAFQPRWSYVSESAQSFVPETEDDACPIVTINIAPLSSTAILQVPPGDNTLVNALHVDLLHTMKVANSSLATPNEDTLKEITHNFYELAALAQARRLSQSSPFLPYHLAALDTMHTALNAEPTVE